jgi:hypothetical protein
MVKVSYCPNCMKAYRFHFKKKLICRSCKEPFETIDVKRSKYFTIQLPILFIGFILLFYSVYKFSSTSDRLAENFGFFIFGIALVLFALAFQILDSKNMELLAKNKGLKKYGEITDVQTTSKDMHKIKTLDFDMEEGKKDSRVIRGPKKKVTADDLFVKPNMPEPSHSSRLNRPVVKKPSKKPINKSSKQVILDDMSDSAPEKKPARKIRRAI